jgi:hypothetical protein
VEIQLTTLDELRALIRELDRRSFAERHGGAYLLAMGFLASEEIARAKPRPKASVGRDATEAFSFGPRLRHAMGQSHPLAGHAFALRPRGDQPSVLVGRSMDCDITIPDSSVSERHCRIALTPTAVTVEDLGSTNGTSINLSALEPNSPAELADEDIISVGRYSFQLLTAQSLYRELSSLMALEAWDRDHPGD